MMKVRMYNTETGRFTTPDLLWAAFPSHTPYHYAYNSPLIWSDPSGLAPEKERDKEKLLNIELDWEGVYNVWNEIQYENGRMAKMDFSSYMMDFKEAFNTRFCGSGGGRTGASKTYNGVSLRIGITGFVEGINYNYTTHIPTSRGILDVPTTVQDNAISSGETHESVMNAFIGGINDILKADARFFDNLYGRDISVVIMHSSLIKYKEEGGYAGLHSGFKGTNKSVISLAGDVLTGNTIIKNYPDVNGYKSPHKNYMIIAHEFSHAIHFAKSGDNFFDYNWRQQELFAIKNTNRIQSFYSDPNRNIWSSISPFWGLFYKSTWWHYQIHGY